LKLQATKGNKKKIIIKDKKSVLRC
jgi:hypothetical protein